MTQAPILPVCVCGTQTVYAPGIGAYCPSRACPILDGPFDGSPPAKLVLRSREDRHADEITRLTSERDSLGFVCAVALEVSAQNYNDAAEYAGTAGYWRGLAQAAESQLAAMTERVGALESGVRVALAAMRNAGKWPLSVQPVLTALLTPTAPEVPMGEGS